MYLCSIWGVLHSSTFFGNNRYIESDRRTYLNANEVAKTKKKIKKLKIWCEIIFAKSFLRRALKFNGASDGNLI